MISFAPDQGSNIEQHLKVVSLNNLLSGLLKLKDGEGERERCVRALDHC